MSLAEIQKQLRVGKDKTNDFGGYNYRTAEGILAAVKPFMPEGSTLTLTDKLQECGGQIFVVAKATITIPSLEPVSCESMAMHPHTKKGMDPSQISGSASSYARKYALSGLFAIDDSSADPDAAKEPYEKGPDPAIASAVSDIGFANTGKELLAAVQKHNAVGGNNDVTMARIESLRRIVKGAPNEAAILKMAEVFSPDWVAVKAAADARIAEIA